MIAVASRSGVLYPHPQGRLFDTLCGCCYGRRRDGSQLLYKSVNGIDRGGRWLCSGFQSDEAGKVPRSSSGAGVSCFSNKAW
jgi:hypothetical protein